MSLTFQSIRSSSSGNCLALWSQTTRLLIDCGLSSMKRTRQALGEVFDDLTSIDAVLLTHTHSDHISYYPLRVLDDSGLTVWLHEACVDQLKTKHYKEYGFAGLDLQPYQDSSFAVGDFLIKPFEVSHNPAYPTFGYEILCQDKKIVIATDFNQCDDIVERFLDADFIFIESNHDLELLRQYYNPNSCFHLPNPDTAQFLVNVVAESKKCPQTIMLGHLSDQRNAPKIALRETMDAFEKAEIQIDFELLAAPLKERGIPVQIT